MGEAVATLPKAGFIEIGILPRNDWIYTSIDINHWMFY
jgi:hypothetical protein